MNITTSLTVLAYALMAAAPCLAETKTMPAGALIERMADMSPGAGDLHGFYDGASSRRGAAVTPVAVPRAALYRSELDAPRIIRVNHLHKPGEGDRFPAGRPRGNNSLERGYAWTMHPATELLDRGNAGFKVAGFVLGVVLFIPALVLAGLNYVASNSRLTKGTSWHRHG